MKFIKNLLDIGIIHSAHSIDKSRNLCRVVSIVSVFIFIIIVIKISSEIYINKTVDIISLVIGKCVKSTSYGTACRSIGVRSASAGIAALGKSVKYFKDSLNINFSTYGNLTDKSNDLCDNSLVHLAVAVDDDADKLLNGIGSSAYINIGKSDTAEYVADSAAACSSVFSKSREAE